MANYVKTFLKDKMVASITPSSKFTVKKVCRKIDFSKKSTIVEYGPGNGVFTKYILSKMGVGSKLIAIETNEEFVDELKKVCDPRLKVVHDTAENVNSIVEKADYVLSGIPFSYIEPGLKTKIIRNTHKSLKNGGKFLVYQFSSNIKEYLSKNFDNVNTDYEIINIPPLFIFEAVK